MNPASPHYTMTLYKHNPVIHIGDTVRTASEVEWMDGFGNRIFVPAGTLGTVKLWLQDGREGLAFDFQGFTHPKFVLFPMSLSEAGKCRYSNDIALLTRAPLESRSADDLVEPLSRRALQQTPEPRVPDLLPVLEPGSDPPAGGIQSRGEKSLGVPSSQKSGPRGRRGGQPGARKPDVP
jgi:hypothetical protein